MPMRLSLWSFESDAVNRNCPWPPSLFPSPFSHAIRSQITPLHSLKVGETVVDTLIHFQVIRMIDRQNAVFAFMQPKRDCRSQKFPSGNRADALLIEQV